MTTEEELMYVLTSNLQQLVQDVDTFNSASCTKSAAKLGILKDGQVPLYYRVSQSAHKSIIPGVYKYAFITLSDIHINGKENRQLYNCLVNANTQGLYFAGYKLVLAKDHNFYGTTRSILAFVKETSDTGIYHVTLDKAMLNDIASNCSVNTIKKLMAQI